MPNNGPPSGRSRVARLPNRANYSSETVRSILDAGFLCHVGFVIDGQPFVIPTSYGRCDNTLYFHGSAASRMLRNLASGIEVCVTVTLFDGLVLARSAFHHSMNYRSVVVFGTAMPVEDKDEKTNALRVISEQILKGRWADVRPPNPKELKATSVLALLISDASAKIRTGPPADDEED
jgi:nitroimidazol reductase NimA-like FMN-containing flavoprotein (pyridoxamine 5'-phosphate oxidase superfamily)